MYLISKVLSGWADPYFRDLQASGTQVYARVALRFRQVQVQFDPNNGTTLDELMCTFNGNMVQASMEFHDQYGLDGVG